MHTFGLSLLYSFRHQNYCSKEHQSLWKLVKFDMLTSILLVKTFLLKKQRIEFIHISFQFGLAYKLIAYFQFKLTLPISHIMLISNSLGCSRRECIKVGGILEMFDHEVLKLGWNLHPTMRTFFVQLRIPRYNKLIDSWIWISSWILKNLLFKCYPTTILLVKSWISYKCKRFSKNVGGKLR